VRFLFASLCLLLATGPAAAQHGLGAREQWQPQVGDTDARLQQSVEIDILGRAAVPALELLSEATGASLSVAPEDLATVGERKLSIFAHGCTLKDIMVQLCEALQECHWDIDASGHEPVYLLHRDSDAERTIRALIDWPRRSIEQRRAEARASRLQVAAGGLTLTEAEIAALAESDPKLAQSLQDPYARTMLEAAFSLPERGLAEFVSVGRLGFGYGRAPPGIQQAAARMLDAQRAYVAKAAEEMPCEELDAAVQELTDLLDNLPHSTITIHDYGADRGRGVWMSVEIPGVGGEEELLIPAVSGTSPRASLSAPGRVGTTPGASEGREASGEPEVPEPTDPDLLQAVSLPAERLREFAECQRLLARETGLSVIADYFAGEPASVPPEAREGMPLYLLLDAMCERRGHYTSVWRKAGRCLVFFDAEWYKLTQSEVPESVILAWREKLRTQGAFSLDDLAALAVELEDVEYVRWRRPFPDDLQDAGAEAAVGSRRWALLLYSSLSPDQIEAAHAAEGLSCHAMGRRARQRVLDLAEEYHVPSEEAPQATFTIQQSPVGQPIVQGTEVTFSLRFPSRPVKAAIYVRIPNHGRAPVGGF